MESGEWGVGSGEWGVGSGEQRMIGNTFKGMRDVKKKWE